MCLARSTPIDIVTAHGHKYDKQIFNDMDFIISSSDLQKAVMAVSKAIPTKSALPILEDFLFELDSKVLRITASDSELTLRTEVEP